MPGYVSLPEARGQAQLASDANFSMVVVGASSDSAVAAGALSPLYGDPSTAVSDLALGDGVDALTQAITVTPGNPSPAPCAFYRTPQTTPGVRGTIDTSGVTGAAIVTATSGTHPTGTLAVKVEVVDDGNDGAGCAIGTAGLVLKASVNADAAATFLPEEQLGTATTWKVKIGGVETGVQYDFEPASAALSALYTKVTLLQTTLTGTGHFTITSGSPAVHASADTAGDTALAAVAAATTKSTCVTNFNACLTYLRTHVASAVFHTGADATAVAALAAIPLASNVADVDLYLDDLINAYQAHAANVSSVHGSADGTNTITDYTPAPGTLKTGDTWVESVTTPPMWAAADLYTPASGGTDASGAFAAIAESADSYGIVAISEPVASSDFSTVVAGLNYVESYGKRPRVVIRFRDPAAGEDDATYIAAFQVFCAACHDDRITVCAGSGWLTDAYSGRRYLRSFLPAYLARLAARRVTYGQLGERLALNPGWVSLGPLEGFSLKDDNGNTVGHDEAKRGGIEAANGASTGRGLCCYHLRNVQRAGTYLTNRGTVLYPVGSRCLTPQDRDTLNALKTAVEGELLDAIGGTDIVDPATLELDEEIRNGLAARCAKKIRDNYAAEFANAEDVNLVSVDPTVSKSGAQVTITATLAPQLYDWTDAVIMKIAATR